MEAKNPYHGENEKVYAKDQVVINCYTDPLCCWSWGFRPHLQRLLEEFPGQILIDYCMGGLIPDWKNFSDPMNSIHKPTQMGPMWMQASHLTGAPINDLIWMEDPPSSSYPACIAVKTAELQSTDAEEKMLFQLSRAVMEKGLNIAKTEIIAALAEELAIAHPEILDMDRFKQEYNGEESREAFREDLKKVRLNNIGRFPTLTIHPYGSEKGVMITGYRPYEALLAAVKQVIPL